MKPFQEGSEHQPTSGWIRGRGLWQLSNITIFKVVVYEYRDYWKYMQDWVDWAGRDPDQEDSASGRINHRKTLPAMELPITPADKSVLIDILESYQCSDFGSAGLFDENYAFFAFF